MTMWISPRPGLGSSAAHPAPDSKFERLPTIARNHDDVAVVDRLADDVEQVLGGLLGREHMAPVELPGQGYERHDSGPPRAQERRSKPPPMVQALSPRRGLLPPAAAAHDPPMAILGPAGSRPILLRQVMLAAGMTLASVGAALALNDWGFLSIGGAMIACQGAVLTASRLFRLGPDHADDATPPATEATGRVRLDGIFEYGRRAEDQYKAAIGVCLIVAGTILSGAAVFALARFLPFQ